MFTNTILKRLSTRHTSNQNKVLECGELHCDFPCIKDSEIISFYQLDIRRKTLIIKLCPRIDPQTAHSSTLSARLYYGWTDFSPNRHHSEVSVLVLGSGIHSTSTRQATQSNLHFSWHTGLRLLCTVPFDSWNQCSLSGDPDPAVMTALHPTS